MDDQQMPDALAVRCACGWEVRGSEEEVVGATREHGERLHNMTASREQILAMAIRPESASAGANPGDPPS